MDSWYSKLSGIQKFRDRQVRDSEDPSSGSLTWVNRAAREAEFASAETTHTILA